MVTPHPRPKEARKEPSRGPTRTTGSKIQVRRYGGHKSNPWTLTKRVVDTEVKTTVDNDANNRGDEATVETGKTIGLEGLAVDINETVELAVSSTLRGLGVVSKTGTGIVERVDEEQGRSTSSTTGGDVASEPAPVALGLLETEQGLEVILCRNTSGKYTVVK